MEKIKIRFNATMSNALKRDIPEYLQQIKEVIKPYIDNKVLESNDVTITIVQEIIKQNGTPFLATIQASGLKDIPNGATFAIRSAIVQQIDKIQEKAISDLQALWAKREANPNRYRNVSESMKANFIYQNGIGNIDVDTRAIEEYCTTYLEQNPKTLKLYERAQKLYQELKELDADLIKASLNPKFPITVLGNLHDNSVIKVEYTGNIWLDLPVFANIDGNINRHDTTVKNRADNWHIEQIEK